MFGRFLLIVLTLGLCTFVVRPEMFEAVFQPFTQNDAPAIYTQTSLLRLTLSHLALVFCAVLASTIIAVALGILVTREFGREFLPLARTIASVGQTIPPVAVLALSVPMMGFGAAPTLVALFLYGLLPIFENTVTGLTNLPPNVVEAARGVGLIRRQRLWSVELPLAFPMILAGIRLSTVISLATATIGSTIAAQTLGEVIIAGLLTSNSAYVLQGGLVVGLIAIILYEIFSSLEHSAARKLGFQMDT